MHRSLRVAASLTLPLVPARADFDYPDFASTAGITLVGSAVASSARVRLTPNASTTVGGAWHQVAQRVDAGFVTTFAFQLGANVGADGFAFVIQNSAASPLGLDGCRMGYDGLANSLAVEFDTYSNGSCEAGVVGDPAGIHVGVHSLGTAPNSVAQGAALAVTQSVPGFDDGNLHTARVTYANGTLSIYVDNMAQPVLIHAVNLAQLLSLSAGKAFAGFTAATGGLAEVHELVAWSFDESAPPGGNTAPNAPTILEPTVNGVIVNAADVHMETGPFSDPNAGDTHVCTDWEIWTISPSARVWSTACIGGVEKLHTHFGDGVFEGSHAGRTELFASTNYKLRVRHRDSSGHAGTEWSAWSERTFVTGGITQVFPLELEDVAASPAPRWIVASTGADVILPPAATPPRLSLESGTLDLALEIVAHNGATNSVINPAPLAEHFAMRVRMQGGTSGISLPATNLIVVDDDCATHAILLPALSVAPGTASAHWIAASGATYLGNVSQTIPSFTTLARGLNPPWGARQEGFAVETVAGGFQLPVNIAFVPNAGPNPSDPFFYVTELYGTIKVVARDRTLSVYASGLLNFNPTGAFPGSGEQGLSGIAVDPLNGDVYAAMLYAAANPANHYPKLVRFTSLDGGKTAATQTTILDMSGESQGQSHQVSNLTITTDRKLICHMGDGFTTATALNLSSFRGKILRLELSGAPVTSNPFYDAGNGISATDYVYAYGVRNPFGGAWRASDDRHYVVENGPSVDRFAQIQPGRNFGWTGSDSSMQTFALYNWVPSSGPVNLVFIQPQTFGGSGFPASKMGHAFVTESGATYGNGQQSIGKRVTEWILDANGALIAGPIPFLQYAGVSRATACALEAGPDGLYMTELYNDSGSNPIAAGARVLRIYYDPFADCNQNGVDDVCDIATGASSDIDDSGVPDECECAGINYCTAKQNSLGCVPSIGASGSANLSAPDDFVLLATNVINQTQGLATWSAAPSATPFHGGTKCVQSPIHRMPILSSGGSSSGSDCTGAFSSAFTDSTMAAQGLSAGTTIYFQFWSRDAGFPPPGNYGLTDGLRVLICP